MPGVVLGPDCQALAALIGNIIAIAYICPGFAFHDLASGRIGIQCLGIHIDAEIGQNVAGGNGHICGIAGRLGAIAAVPDLDEMCIRDRASPVW